VRGRDTRGFAFEENTASENLCRSGAAFHTRFDLAIGSNLEIRIPMQGYPSRRYENDFETQGRVVHVSDSRPDGEKLVGVQFVGPRFQKVFRSESVALGRLLQTICIDGCDGVGWGVFGKGLHRDHRGRPDRVGVNAGRREEVEKLKVEKFKS